MSKKNTIRITVEGGMIQEVERIPENVRIVVRDYDMEGVDPDRLTSDEEGRECVESNWEKN